MKMKQLLSIFAVACLASGVMADKIVTVTDDVINGTVTGIKGGNVTIDTAFAGTLTIACDQIKTIDYASENTLFARTDTTDKDKVEVSVSRDAEGNVILIPVEDKTQALALDDVQTLWATDGEDPDFPPVKMWAFSASLGMTGHEGATSDISVSAYIDAVRTSEHNTLKLYGSMAKSRSEGVKTSEQYIGGLDFEHRPTERWSWYLRDEVQHNRFNDYKLRNVVGSGGGFYFWNTNTDGRVSLLRFRLGLAHTYTEHYTKKPNSNARLDESDLAIDVGLLFHYDFVCGVSWNTELTYTPLVDDLDKGTLVHETKISYLLKELGTISSALSDVSLQLGMRNEYQTETLPGAESTDTTWYLRFSKSW